MNEDFKHTLRSLREKLTSFSNDIQCELNTTGQSKVNRNCYEALLHEVREDIVFVTTLDDINKQGQLSSAASILAYREYNIAVGVTEKYIPIRHQMRLHGYHDLDFVIKHLTSSISSGLWVQAAKMLAALPKSPVEAHTPAYDMLSSTVMYVNYVEDAGVPTQLLIHDFDELFMYCSLIKGGPLFSAKWRAIESVGAFRECYAHLKTLSDEEDKSYQNYLNAYDNAIVLRIVDVIHKQQRDIAAMYSLIGNVAAETRSKADADAIATMYDNSEIDAMFKRYTKVAADNLIITCLCLLILIAIIHMFIGK